MATVASTTVGERIGPLDRLRALHRDGRLAHAYPEVPGLLAELASAGDPAGPPAPDLVRAGQLLARVKPDEILAEHPDTAAVTVAVTGHSTLSGLTAP